MHTHPYMVCLDGVAFASFATMQSALEAVAVSHENGHDITQLSVYDVRPDCAYPWSTVRRELIGYVATPRATDPSRFI